MRKTVPDWNKVLKDSSSGLVNLLGNQEAAKFVQKVNAPYLHWDKFRHLEMPGRTKPEVMWAFTKITRRANSEVFPLTPEPGKKLWLFTSKEHLRSLSYIDSKASGIIASDNAMPDEKQKHKMIVNGLIEEAISSSQIEGASTTRKVAKAMIEHGRAPRNKDERMIFNNFRAMMRLEDWKNRKLDKAFLLELHETLCEGTMENDSDVGRLREDADDVVVADHFTGETVHVPPSRKEADRQLQELFAFANNDDEAFIHPFIKASILHFSLGYIHPFVDGNGRSARAIFYWYLLRQGYWMFKYIPISLQIKKKNWRPGYDRAFQNVETDEYDVTYFLNYKLKLACNAIDDFIKYVALKHKEQNQIKARMLSSNLSERQIEIVSYLQENPGTEIDLKFVQTRNNVVYETARTDVNDLVERKILAAHKRGKKFVYVRGDKFPAN